MIPLRKRDNGGQLDFSLYLLSSLILAVTETRSVRPSVCLTNLPYFGLSQTDRWKLNPFQGTA